MTGGRWAAGASIGRGSLAAFLRVGLPPAAVAMVATLAAAPAAAAGLALDLTVSSCPFVDAAEVRRIVGVELRTALAASGRDAPKAAVVCGAEGAAVSVVDPLTDKTTSRTLDLDASPPLARNRVLALGIAELLRWSWAELAAAPSPPPRAAERAEARVIGARAVAAAQPGPALRLAVHASSHTSFEGVGPLVGLGLGATLGAGRTRLGLGLAAEAGIGDGVRLGPAAAAQLGPGARGTVALEARLLSGTLRAERVWRAGSTELGLGAGARIGYAMLEGRPADALLTPRRTSGAWGGPAVSATATLLASRGVALTLSGEAGWALLTVTGDVAELETVRLAGPFVGATLGLGIGR